MIKFAELALRILTGLGPCIYLLSIMVSVTLYIVAMLAGKWIEISAVASVALALLISFTSMMYSRARAFDGVERENSLIVAEDMLTVVAVLFVTFALSLTALALRIQFYGLPDGDMYKLAKSTISNHGVPWVVVILSVPPILCMLFGAALIYDPLKNLVNIAFVHRVRRSLIRKRREITDVKRHQ